MTTPVMTPELEEAILQSLDYDPACTWNQHTTEEVATHVGKVICPKCGRIIQLLGPECIAAIKERGGKVKCARCLTPHLSVRLDPL